MKNNLHHASVLALVAAILLSGMGCEDKNFKDMWYSCWSGLIAQGPSPNPSPGPYRPGSAARLTLEANLGQSDSRYKFLGRGDGYFLFLNDQETVLDLGTRQIRLHLDGARPGAPATTGDAFQRTHYLLGPDPNHWIPNVPVYDEVGFTGVYPGVDIVYYAREGKLEHDFRLAPGADPSRIRWALQGVDRVSRDGDALLLHAGDLNIRWDAPVAYQGSRRIPAGYKLDSAGIRFTLGEYDRSKPLVIDPVIRYVSYLGRRGGELAGRSTVDAQGNVYLTGASTDAQYPTTPGAAATNPLGFSNSNIVVTKMDASGSRLLYSTYIGGVGSELATGVALDAAGALYITGVTDSTDFPVTPGAYQTKPAPTPTGTKDFANCFITKLNPAGSALVYSTFLSGSLRDGCTAIAVDRAGSAVVIGASVSTDFPTTPDAPQSRYRLGQGDPSYDAIVAKLNPAGSALVFSTFIGGNGNDSAHGVAVDNADNIYVTGVTNSGNTFPVTDAAFDRTYNGQGGSPGFYNIGDAFLLKLNPLGTQLIYSTLLGGARDDSAFAVAVDPQGNAYVTGNTLSQDFPVTAGAAQRTWAGAGGQPYLPAGDIFLTKVNPAGTAIVYSTLLGGSLDDRAISLALGPDNSVHLVGHTLSTNFPVTNDAAQTLLKSTNPTDPRATGDGFYAHIDPAGTRVLYATYLGGANSDWLTGVSLDATGAITVTGTTASSDIATTAAAYQRNYFGSPDNFLPMGDLLIARFGDAPAVSVSAVVNAASYNAASVSPGLIVTLGGTGLGPDTLAGPVVQGGVFATQVAETRVLFDGIPAPILYASGRQTSVVAPFALANRATTQVVVEYRGSRSAPLTIPVTPTAPGLFSANSSGTGQAAALNQDGSFNSRSNPAQPGSILVLYGTGEGISTPPNVDGAVISGAKPLQNAQFRVLFGTKNAQIEYVGAAPGLISGLLQVNVRVPEDLPPGDHPVQIEASGRPSQPGLTLAIR
jgi:uncharacterized protein (TIGR03437 family)